MKKYVITIVAMMLSFSIIAQSNSNIDSTWKLNETKNGVSFYHKIIKCNGTDAAVLAFKNTNPTSVMMSWQEELVIDGNALRTSSSFKSMLLPIGELVQVDCTPKEISFMLVPITNYSGNHTSINKYNYINTEVHTN